MNYGFYTAASGALTNMARMDVMSNNLANVDTVGFKPLGIAVRQRANVKEEDQLGYIDSAELLDTLGAGVMPTATRVSTTQGALQETGNPLDVALLGEGYLMVRMDDAEQPIGLTRDGRMLVDAQSQRLVHAATGEEVLSVDGEPIAVVPGVDIEIRDDGSVVQQGTAVGQLGVVDVPEAKAMRSFGHGLFHPTLGQIEQRAVSGARVRSHTVEQSAVNAVRTMMGVTNAGRAASSNLGMVGILNESMQLAISRLGRVS